MTHDAGAVSGDGSAADLVAARESDLAAIIEAIVQVETLDPPVLDGILRTRPKDGRGFFSKREILAAFRALPTPPIPARAFEEKLRTCATRTLSGVTPVALLTKPFPCPGECIFCPNDVRMPKSYLPDEPGCRRAEQNRFDPYLQTTSRLRAYERMGHPIDKCEVIVLGGTWSHYPEPYQRWFVARCFEAMTDFGSGDDRDDEVEVDSHAPRPPADDSAGSYNTRVAPFSRISAEETASWDRLEAAHRANERAAVRCVGLSLETRPDCVSSREVLRLRRLGATKVQIGVQSTNDEVLAANQRGHDVAASRRALTLLRAAGFKLQVHWMANLKGSSLAADRVDFARLFEDPAIRPDELKIYPCSLIDGTGLMGDWRAGRWTPYTTEDLVTLLVDVLETVPETCRVSRMIRDIPSPDIVAGNKRTNLREDVESRLRARGTPLREIRAREIRDQNVDPETLEIRTVAYATSVGQEIFLAANTPDDRLAGFLRLSLPAADAPVPEELRGGAVIREVHVYGLQQGIGDRSKGRVQHAGLGTRLVAQAASLANEAGFARLAVISAVGTRPWYRRLGFRDGLLYQVQALSAGESPARADLLGRLSA